MGKLKNLRKKLLKAFEDSEIGNKRILNLIAKSNFQSIDSKIATAWLNEDLLTRKNKIKFLLKENENDSLLNFLYAHLLYYSPNSDTDLKKAEKLYRKAIQLSSEWNLPKLGLAILLSDTARYYDEFLRSIRFAEAISIFSMLHKQEPRKPRHLYNLGLSFVKNQCLEIGEILLKESVKAFPNFSDSYFALCELYEIDKNDLQEAKKWAIKASKLKNENAIYWLSLK
ncbi:hypothetical protein CH370_09600 [Leptospira kmetyi]|uniref:hypothetical protein n=1 Tax=Leptospira kmetyi TaxID=408139 RepID=UPI000C2A5C71|nr:hypothetical protein [Leptospira kmetyi]PJZ41687.1 hypothetical protein CH370_09600 [Leptospira kmetyi]